MRQRQPHLAASKDAREPILPPPNINQDNERQQNGVQKFFGKVKALAQEKIEERKRAQQEEDEEDA